MTRSKRLRLLLLPLLVAVAACDDETTAPDLEPTPEELAVTDPDAALVEAMEAVTAQIGLSETSSLTTVSETDEAPGFGNALFTATFGEPEAPLLTDDIATDSTVIRGDRDRLRMYNVLAVWGRIRPDVDVEPTPIQWDPALQVAEGDAVRVRRALFFEAGDVVHPQEQRNLVEMTSWTSPHVDGVVAQVALHRSDEAETEAAATDEVAPESFLAFRSEPYSISIPADELGGLRVAEVIDDSGNGVLLASIRKYFEPCGAGFMRGRWLQVGPRGGVFGGAWLQVNGRREGYLAGRWGPNAEGDPVFRAKIVNAQGHFLAIMAGTYGDGVYEGEIYGRDREVLGHVKGRYTGEDGHGSFLGAWKQSCSDDDTPDRTCELTESGQRVCTARRAEP